MKSTTKIFHTLLYLTSATLWLFLSGCNKHHQQPQKAVLDNMEYDHANNKNHNLVKGKQTFVLDQIATDILMPPQDSVIKGTILVLPGWNFPRTDWCEKSSLCKQALAQGYCLVMPEMGKSIYPTRYYPHSRKDWLAYPTLTWLCDTLLDTLTKKYNLFLPKEKGGKNFVLGLSTGGRGTVLVLMKKPELWTAGAALSGDYIPEKLPTDNLLTGVYGAFATHKDLWMGEDNPYQNVHRLKTPLYLGHGKKDAVVPVSQTELFYQKLKTTSPDMKVELRLHDSAGHDYRYWDSEVKPMLDFFNEW